MHTALQSGCWTTPARRIPEASRSSSPAQAVRLLPGMVAAATPLPVIGIPRALGNLDGLDSLLSIVQMPAGVPTATVSIDGAKNAGLLAVRTLAVADATLMQKMVDYQADMCDQVLEKDRKLQQKLLGN